MEFLASLAIKALIGTSVCGAVTVGSVYGYDKTLLGFKDNTKTTTDDQGGSSQTEKVGKNGVKGGSTEDVVKGEPTSDTTADNPIPEAGADTNEGDTGPSDTSQEESDSPEVESSTLELVPVVPTKDEQSNPTENPDTTSVTVSEPETSAVVGSSQVDLTINTNPQVTQ